MAITLENTKENIIDLESKGFTKSSVSKSNSINKVLRYDVKRKVYWFSSKRYWYPQDSDIYSSLKTLIYCG